MHSPEVAELHQPAGEEEEPRRSGEGGRPLDRAQSDQEQLASLGPATAADNNTGTMPRNCVKSVDGSKADIARTRAYFWYPPYAAYGSWPFP